MGIPVYVHNLFSSHWALLKSRLAPFPLLTPWCPPESQDPSLPSCSPPVSPIPACGRILHFPLLNFMNSYQLISPVCWVPPDGQCNTGVSDTSPSQMCIIKLDEVALCPSPRSLMKISFQTDYFFTFFFIFLFFLQYNNRCLYLFFRGLPIHHNK